MKVIKTELEGVIIIEPDVFEDERGFFMESYSKKKYEVIGITSDFVQDNHSRSVKGVVRGLHYQSFPGQAKLVRCIKGKIWDVAVDIRKDSTTLGKFVGVELSEKNRKQLFVPADFAHGFASMGRVNDVFYKCGTYYDQKTEYGIAWNDPDISVKWPVKDPIVSDRDRKNMSFKEYLSKC